MIGGNFEGINKPSKLTGGTLLDDSLLASGLALVLRARNIFNASHLLILCSLLYLLKKRYHWFVLQDNCNGFLNVHTIRGTLQVELQSDIIGSHHSVVFRDLNLNFPADN